MRDLQEFEQYVMARWTAFHRLALLLTASESASQDLVQVTLEKAYVAWPKISTMASPDAYVRRIMVNALVSTHRLARNRHEIASADPPERGAPSRDEEVLDHELLWPLVCALPTRQRAVIVLRYYEDLSEREIADALGCAVGTVKSTAHDAMTALRRGITAVRVPEGSDR
ncbi:SigE family RNA polymerase sigma factor [Nocardioides sp.]|uniref:SigE family RNA polymerase sigma factor n=1 Tax=Nocardioides sp. TaxID=35761 RepID=UPI002ED62124